MQHTEEAWAPSCSITGAVTAGHRWTDLCSLSRIVTAAVTNILNRAEVSCTTQLLESAAVFQTLSTLFCHILSLTIKTV